MLPAGTSLQAIRAGLRRKRRLQDLITGKKRHRQNKMHPRMRVTVLLQRNLLVRSGITLSLIALKFLLHFFFKYAKHFKLERLYCSWKKVRSTWDWILSRVASCSATLARENNKKLPPRKETGKRDAEHGRGDCERRRTRIPSERRTAQIVSDQFPNNNNNK